MGAFNPSVLTEKGQNLVAKSLAGKCEITFTKIAVSEDRLSSSAYKLVHIGTIKQVERTVSVTAQDDNRVKVGASFSNQNLSQGYYIRNIGLYAQDPDEGEILYSVAIADESTATADWMPPFSSIGVSTLMVNIITAVSNASSVNVVIDPTANATVAQVLELQRQIDGVSDFVGYDEDVIYGVEIDFENKSITRIAGAEYLTEGIDFNNLAPWGGRKRCILTDEGKVIAYYGDSGYTESGALTEAVTIGGTTYPIGTSVQVMVEQPIFYIKAVPVKAKNATSGKGKQYVKGRFYISPTPKNGFTIPRAFYDDNGIPQNKIYLSAYEGSAQKADGSYIMTDNAGITAGNVNSFKVASIAGVKPMSGKSDFLDRGMARTLANNRGEGWQLHSLFAMAVTEWLFMIEYASLDPQRKVGLGVCTLIDDEVSNSSVITGATTSLGNGSGIPLGGDDGKCSVTYRGEENLWGNIWTWLDCVNIYAKGVNEVWVPKVGTAPTDVLTGTNEYDCLAVYASHSSGFISAFGIDAKYPEILIPTEANGVDTFTDYVYQYTNFEGILGALFGVKWSSGSRCGFSLAFDVSSTHYKRDVGCRLLYVPQSTKTI